jgi:hypothetical protein
MIRKFMTMAAVAALAVAPVAAQAAAPLSIAHSSEARASAGMDEASALRGQNSAVFIGLILAVLFLAIVTADGRDEPSNSP